MRTTRETVTFERPFYVTALDDPLPAGAYVVETDEELIEGLSFLAYRRVGTTLFVPLRHARGGSMQAIKVDPGELAVARDPSTTNCQIGGQPNRRGT